MLNGEICLDKSNKQLIFLKGLFTFKVPFTNGIEIPLINITFFLPALFIGIVAYRYYFYKAMGLAYPKAVECFARHTYISLAQIKKIFRRWDSDDEEKLYKELTSASKHFFKSSFGDIDDYVKNIFDITPEISLQLLTEDYEYSVGDVINNDVDSDSGRRSVDFGQPLIENIRSRGYNLFYYNAFIDDKRHRKVDKRKAYNLTKRMLTINYVDNLIYDPESSVEDGKILFPLVDTNSQNGVYILFGFLYIDINTKTFSDKVLEIYLLPFLHAYAESISYYLAEMKVTFLAANEMIRGNESRMLIKALNMDGRSIIDYISNEKIIELIEKNGDEKIIETINGFSEEEKADYINSLDEDLIIELLTLEDNITDYIFGNDNINYIYKDIPLSFDFLEILRRIY